MSDNEDCQMVDFDGVKYLQYKTKKHRNLTMVITTNGVGERKIFEIINNEYKKLYKGKVKVILKLLTAGDICFIDDETGKPFGSLVERVTVEDLWSKIGKERDQQMQQMREVTKEHGVYIVEGNPMRLRNPTAQKAVNSRINTLPVKWGKDVYMTEHFETSAWLLMNLHISLEHIDEKKMKAFDYDNHTILNAPRNKSEINEGAKMQRILMLIHGISAEKAESIARVYPTITSLFLAYKLYTFDRGGDPATMLSCIEHISGNSTRLGSSCSASVAEFFEVDKIFKMMNNQKDLNLDFDLNDIPEDKTTFKPKISSTKKKTKLPDTKKSAPINLQPTFENDYDFDDDFICDEVDKIIKENNNNNNNNTTPKKHLKRKIPIDEAMEDDIMIDEGYADKDVEEVLPSRPKFDPPTQSLPSKKKKIKSDSDSDNFPFIEESISEAQWAIIESEQIPEASTNPNPKSFRHEGAPSKSPFYDSINYNALFV